MENSCTDVRIVLGTVPGAFKPFQDLVYLSFLKHFFFPHVQWNVRETISAGSLTSPLIK